MRAFSNYILAAVLLILACSASRAQEISPSLTRVEKALDCWQNERRPEWKLERTAAIVPNENVMIVMFVNGGRRVKVSILEHKSEAKAIESMKPGAADKNSKIILDLGDEAYSSGYSDAITFRKGTLTVSVSAHSNIDRLLPLLDQNERWSLRRTEEIALNKGIARSMANLVSALDHACKPMDRY